jgi:hypothetical protein
MITKSIALSASRFEHVSATNADGTPVRCRAMGKCKTWKTRPADFKLPVKYGMYNSFYIDNVNASEWVAA